MKHKILIANFAFFCTISSVYAQWTELHYNFSASITTIEFINSQKGFIGGYPDYFNSSLAFTNDGGQNWQDIDLNELSMINHIHFVNDTLGFFSTMNKSIYKTQNGGQTWDSLNHISFYPDFFKFYFKNANTGFIYSPNSNPGLICRTTDGGNNWEFCNYYMLDVSPRKLNFANDTTNVGYLLSYYGEIFKTYDNGISWAQISQPSTYLYDISFINDTTGFALGESFVLKTVDGGYNWNIFNDSIGGKLLHLYKNGIVYIYDAFTERLIYSPDFFSTFYFYDLPFFIEDFYSIEMDLISDSTGYFSNGGGKLYRFDLFDNSSVQNHINEPKVDIYPNPLSSLLIIKFDRNINNHCFIRIVDLTGQIVLNTVIEQNPISIDIENIIDAGTYIISIYDENLSLLVSKRIVIN